MATFAATKFCTISDLRAVLRSLQVAIGFGSELENRVQGHIDLTKSEDLKPLLLYEAEKRFPSQIEMWMSKFRSQIDRALQSNSRDTVLSRADLIGAYDSFNGYGYCGVSIGFRPLNECQDVKIYPYFGVPNGSTFAGDTNLKHGSILVDTDNRVVYVNSGTTSAPAWVQITPEHSLDLILNPEALKKAAVAGTLKRCFGDGVFENSLKTGTQLGLMVDAEAKFKKEFSEALYGVIDEDSKRKILPGALEMLKWDISGDGLINSFESPARVQSSGLMIGR